MEEYLISQKIVRDDRIAEKGKSLLGVYWANLNRTHPQFDREI